MVDLHANLAISSVATAPSPATSGTSLVVASGEGARFPVAPFNATVWPANALPDPSNAEIVRVTARTTDTLTIVRAQEGTSARTIVAGDLIVASITAKTLTDVEGISTGIASPQDLNLKAWAFDPAMAVATSTVLGSNGLVHVVKLRTDVKISVTNIEYSIITAGATLTASQNIMGLYDANKNLLGSTADQSGIWTATGWKQTALVGGPYTINPGYFYVAWYANGTTRPAFLRSNSSAVVNGGLAAANARWATADTARTTTLPATLGAFTLFATTYFMGVS